MLLSISVCIGQGGIDNQLTVPDIFPASPEASTLGQFGEIQTNQSLGVTNMTIPIHTINAGEFNLPISLNHFYNGLVVDNIPGCLGLGWSLNSGGMVTRQLRGRPDEDVHGYIGDQMIGLNWVVPHANGELNSAQIRALKENAVSASWDTQPDKFIVSVGSMQATFYFDENKTPVIKPYMPYLIEVINDDFNDGISITDDNGVIYRFTEKEYSKRLPPFFGVGDIPPTPIDGYISGWKVTEIITPDGQSITFNYDEYIYNQTVHYGNQKIQLPAQIQPYEYKQARYEIRSKIVTEINFPSGHVEFNHISQTPTEDDSYLNRLQNIEVFNSNNESINTYDLAFNNVNKTRKLLTSVTINDDSSNNYQLTYYGSPSDDIPYYSQDFWGFYNSNNEPRLVDVQNLYDLRSPDFNKSMIGSLSSITYPTKGTTEFMYESNTYDPGVDGDEIDDFVIDSGECGNLSATLSAGVGINSTSPSLNVSDIKTFTVTSDTYMTLNLQVIKNAPLGSVYAGLRRVQGTSINCADSSIINCDFCDNARVFFDGGVAQSTLEDSFISTRQLKLTPGTYELYTTAESPFLNQCGGSTNPNPPFNGCESLSATATIHYSDGANTPVIPRSRVAGGIRVSQIKSCPDDNPENCIIKQYQYETDDISQGFLFRKRYLFISEFLVDNTQTLPSGEVAIETNGFRNYSSSSNIPLGSYLGSPLIYKEVIQNNRDHLGNNLGAIKTTFNFVELPVSVLPHIPKDYEDHRQGKVLEQHHKNDAGIEVKNIFNQYNFSEDLNINQRVISYKAVITHHVSQAVTGGDAIYGEYYINSNNTSVDRLIQTRDFTTLGTDFLEEKTTFTYTSPQGHVKDQTLEYDNGDILKTSYKYPYDPYQNQMAVADELEGLNRLTSITEKLIYNKDNLIHQENILYKNWGGTILEPEFIQIGKANDTPENRVVYQNYDTQGNPTEYIQDNGSPLTVLWGYNKQYPIASITNSTYLEVMSVAGLDTSVFDNPSSDIALRSELNKIREALPHAQVTSYTYKPLVGITSETDPRGYIMYYQYDSLNRLERVKDQNGKVYRKNEYNFRTND